MSIFDTEQLIRSATFFGWWSPTEPLLEHRRPSELVDVTSDEADLAAA